MKKDTIINILAFVVPSVIVYLMYSYDGILYALAIGLVCWFVIKSIMQGMNEEYRKKASVADKIRLLTDIIVFPILFYIIFYNYNNAVCDTDLTGGVAWASLIFTLLIYYGIIICIKYVVKLFSRD